VWYFTLDGADYSGHAEQATMIRRYIGSCGGAGEPVGTRALDPRLGSSPEIPSR
jgi:hypothetical protein